MRFRTVKASVFGVVIWLVSVASLFGDTTDVRLGQGGTLVGRWTSAEGQPIAGQTVSISSRWGVTSAVTNSAGEFAAKGLSAGGVYEISGQGVYQSLRVWQPKVAPPSAANSVELSHADESHSESRWISHRMEDSHLQPPHNHWHRHGLRIHRHPHRHPHHPPPGS